MVGTISVLIVDDAVVARRALTDALADDPGITVVGTAPNGRVALSRIAQLNPDVVTLDVEMPEWDGIQTLIEIRKVAPRLPVIMVSTLTERGAMVTVEALTRGASDYVTKPSGAPNYAASVAMLRVALVPKIKALAAKQAIAAAAGPGSSNTASTSLPIPTAGANAAGTDRASAAVQLVVIGASTGGPNALMDVLPRLPAAFPVPILVVQHMPPMFTKHFSERLAKHCRIPVVEAADNTPLAKPGIWLAPGDRHLVVAGPTLKLTHDPPENFCRPSVDVLFRSAAKYYGAKVMGVMLTGMGQDGLVGCRAIREAGGTIVVQDEATSVVWGMPGAVARANLAHRILPLPLLANEIVRHTMPK